MNLTNRMLNNSDETKLAHENNHPRKLTNEIRTITMNPRATQNATGHADPSRSATVLIARTVNQHSPPHLEPIHSVFRAREFRDCGATEETLSGLEQRQG
jgi:hypothetical protein